MRQSKTHEPAGTIRIEHSSATCRNVASQRTLFACSACGFSGNLRDLCSTAPGVLTCPSCKRTVDLPRMSVNH